jgi:hypothetical protein
LLAAFARNKRTHIMATDTDVLFREARPMLTTEVRSDGLFVKISMIPSRKISLRGLQSVRVQRGWPGLTTPGLGYSYHGFQGVRLQWTNGKRLLIGSKNPEKLSAAIKAAIK